MELEATQFVPLVQVQVANLRSINSIPRGLSNVCSVTDFTKRPPLQSFIHILAYILATSRHLADKVYRPLLDSNLERQAATFIGLTILSTLVHVLLLYIAT